MKRVFNYIIGHEWPTYVFVFVAILGGLFINLLTH